MILVMIVALTFGIGASLTRLITSDGLFLGFRARWEMHFQWRMDAIIQEANRTLLVEKAPDDTENSMRVKILHALDGRAAEEPKVSFWAVGAARAKDRPWSVRSGKLSRLGSYYDFVSCPFCVGFWVFLVVAVWTWWRALGCATNSYALLYPYPAADYWLVGGVVGTALAMRWVYALIAVNVDR